MRLLNRLLLILFSCIMTVQLMAGDFDVYMSPNPVIIGQSINIAAKAPNNVKKIMFKRGKNSFVYLKKE